MMPSSRGLLDPVIEAYKKDIDRTLLRENLELSVEGRLSQLMDLQRLADLIHLKRSAGRVRDLEAVAEMEALREERG